MKALALAILVLGCNLSLGGEIAKHYDEQMRGRPDADLVQKRDDDPPRKVPAITEIGIERGVCLEPCPRYTLIVKNDGTFRYTGEECVEHKGRFTGTISIVQFARLAEFIHDSDFLAMEEHYQANVTCGSNTFITVVADGKRKTIRYDGGEPSKLWAIERLIDALLIEAKWNDRNQSEIKPK